MSVVTKIILDTSEYNRLLSIEKAYRELKSAQKLVEANQTGSGPLKTCKCKTNEKEVDTSSPPPLSKIIASNDKARAVDIPQRGILPSITDPNDEAFEGFGSSLSATHPSSRKEKDKEYFNATNFRSLANEKDKWYFLGHFEEK